MSKNILIIEDDKYLQKLITKKLIKEGFNVSMADDGKEGVKKAEEEKPDLILLDLVLPGISGFDVLTQIKENSDQRISGIPVIILSNLGQKEDAERGLKLGAVDYLIKAHFTLEEIVEKISAVLK